MHTLFLNLWRVLNAANEHTTTKAIAISVSDAAHVA